MKSYIYKSRRKDGLYIYLPQKDDFSNMPQALYDSIGQEPIFVMEVTLSQERQLAQEDVNTVMKNLEEQGFHIQMPPVSNNLTTFKEPAKLVD